jgi:hypothetical protein
MIKRERQKIYSQYEINVITFYATMIFFLPLILVFTYLFEVDKYLNINSFMLSILIANMIIMVTGTIYLIFKKDRMKRRVKATYRSEYYYLLFLVTFGLLGFIVVYDYLGGDRTYIANILVVVFSILVYLVIYLGRRFYNFDYLRKK